MTETKRSLKVFLCHARNDYANVKTLYDRLVKDGVDAWLDKEKLIPGQDWELEIRKAVQESDVVVVCLSRQFNKAGIQQKEVRLALDTAMEKPEGEIFIIPAQLEDCENLEHLKKWHVVDLFEENGYDMLVKALRIRAESIDAALHIEETPTPKVPNLFKLKKEYILAILGLAATIIAVIINLSSAGKWFTQMPTPTAAENAQALVSPIASVDIYHTEIPSTDPAFQLGSTVQHRVSAGESLFQIVRCYGADLEQALSANPQIGDSRNLPAGMLINIPNIGSSGVVYGPPCATFYTIQNGDTWLNIAIKFNADAAVLREINQEVAFIEGSMILIPASSIRPLPVTTSLFTVDADVSPNQDNCYSVTISSGQIASFITTTSKDVITKVVRDPNEEVFQDTGDLMFGGNPDPGSGEYRYCIFNRSASTIAYKLEVNITR